MLKGISNIHVYKHIGYQSGRTRYQPNRSKHDVLSNLPSTILYNQGFSIQERPCYNIHAIHIFVVSVDPDELWHSTVSRQDLYCQGIFPGFYCITK